MNPRIIFDSVDEMLTPDALSALSGMNVKTVTRQPLAAAHRSGNELEEIRLQGNAGTRRLILKKFLPLRDWVMWLTHDTLAREAMLFVHGMYKRLPKELTVPLIAAARNESSWATLMHDVSAELLPASQVLPENTARLLIENLAALHAHFWEDPALKNPELGLSSLEDFVTILAPTRLKAEIEAGRAHAVLQLADRGWKQFETDAPQDVVEIVHELQNETPLLVGELERMPQTLVHADYKLPNLGMTRAGHTIALDWQDATRGGGVLDLGYFLALNAQWLPFAKEAAIGIYWQALAARGRFVSTRDIELGLVAGGPLRLLWLMTLDNQNDLDWWYDLIRRIELEE